MYGIPADHTGDCTSAKFHHLRQADNPMTVSHNKYVGRPIPRTEDPRLLRGNGCFVDDMHRPGAVHAVIVRSQIAHGHLRSIDASRALSIPGVCAVLTAADIKSEIGVLPFRIAPLEG